MGIDQRSSGVHIWMTFQQGFFLQFCDAAEPGLAVSGFIQLGFIRFLNKTRVPG
jgi:hypothetical protein